MTESEWQNEQWRPQYLAISLTGTKVTRTKAGKRKLRLFACACCRLTWDLLTDPRLRNTVEVAEKFAEGQTGKEELQKASESVSSLVMGTHTPEAPGYLEAIAASMAHQVAEPPAHFAAFYMTACSVSLAGSYGSSEQERDSVLCRLLHCVLGNPFRPSPMVPRAVLTWKDGTVPRLAQAIYEQRHLPEGTLDTELLSILADALEDAGCEDEALVAHLRSEGPHVLGCWPVDLLLGKGCSA